MKNERTKTELTQALYETDGQLKEFSATVLSVVEKEEVIEIILDKTAFFPEGGGQKSDKGYIDGFEVLDVQTDDAGNIVHTLSKEALSITMGAIVQGEIDYECRLARMQNHGAEHLICGIIHNKYGYENVGFHMMDVGVRLDINGMLTKEQLKEVERMANEIVYDNVPIIISYPTSDEARELSYRSKLDTFENIRLVSIGDIDVCACCAPHLSSTGQFGVIKIIDSMPHRQGMRITMVAGAQAYEDYSALCEDNSKIMYTVSAKRDETAKFVEELSDRYLKLKNENTEIKKELTRIVTQTVLADIKSRAAGDTTPIVYFTEVLDNVGLRNLINECTQNFAGVVAGFIGNDTEGYKYIISCSADVDLPELAKNLSKEFIGRGGGSKQMIQGSLTGTREKIENYIKGR